MREKVTDVQNYWRERGKGYRDEFKRHGFFTRRRFQRQEKVLLNTLKALNFASVLKVGCGFGRITKLILDNFPSIQRYKGIDFAPEQIESCRHYLSSLEKVELSVGKVQDLEEADSSYDLVIAVEVLMHIPLDEIEIALSQMARVASKYIVNVDWYRPTLMEAGGYCFVHDYNQLYEALGVPSIRVTPILKPFVYSVSFGLGEGFKISRFRREQHAGQQIWVATKN